MAKLKKTPTEIKYEALLRKMRPRLSKKAKVKKANKQTLSEKIAFRKKQNYPDFLKSRYWGQVRKSVLKRDNDMCIICKSTVRLEVHHDTYKNHGNELKHLGDLITLCRKCHKEHHYAQL